MSIKTPHIVLVILVLLSACSAGPNFKTPAPTEGTAFTSGDEVVPLNQRIVLGKQIETDWWTLFASGALDSLIHQAVKNNYDLTSAKETLAQAAEAVKAESGSLSPQISLSATAGRQKYGVALFGPSNFNIPPFSYYQVGPSISWSPDLFGGGRRAIERQQALENYQVHEIDAIYIALTGDTASAALEVASASAEIAAVKSMIAVDRKTLALVQESYAAGASTRVDVLGMKIRLNIDQAILPPLQQRLSVSRHALSIYLGKAPADWTPPNIEFNSLMLPDKIPVSVPSELVKRRPDILAAEANLHAASAAIGVATANQYPQLTLAANMMQEALTPAGIFSAAGNAWSLASELTAPIFDGGKLIAEKREAEHAYQASLARYQQTIIVAFRQVADALTSLAHDDEEVAIRNNALDDAGISLELMHSSYRAGSVGLLPVQNAQHALARAQLDIVQARNQRLLDCVRLFVALGGSPIATKQS
ncbi:MAG TPA: efflux transporter outer membrane subunit [Gallionella sp.]|nr:efflux transporter outer membrane subunit [Gallionella sp.]